VKLARFRHPNAACFPSYVEYRLNKNIINIIYAYKYIQNRHPKVGLLEDIREEEKKER
jgi:hypothetical protein